MTLSRTALLAALFVAGCSCNGKSGDSGDSGTPTGSTTSALCGGDLEGQNLPSALYSVWGSSPTDVWTVGVDDGNGPLVLHYDGAWSRVDTGLTGDLLWVWGESADSIWFSGRGGRVVHHIPSAGTFTEHAAADPTDVLWGLWGSSGNDIWAVGQTAGNTGTIVHYDGTDWSPATVPQQAVAAPVWKAWGTSASDVFLVGAADLIAHWDGTELTLIDTPITSQSVDFLTVSGCGDEVVAVGGYGNGKVARSTDGGVTWVDDSPPPLSVAPAFIGTSVSCTQGAYAVGGDLAIWKRGPSGWAATCEPSFAGIDFHGTWVDEDGGVWSVGGNLDAGTTGAVDYTGPAAVPDISL